MATSVTAQHAWRSRAPLLALAAASIVWIVVTAVPGFAQLGYTNVRQWTMWPDSETPSVASVKRREPTELGVKFQTSVPGVITSLRFYKGKRNDGPHVGSLWTADGQLLASATFTDESATGWQQVKLAEPVGIKLRTTYVVSYYAPRGHYASDTRYFKTDTGRFALGTASIIRPLAWEPNGVMLLGAQGFPIEHSGAGSGTNFWVDVVFESEDLGVNVEAP